MSYMTFACSGSRQTLAVALFLKISSHCFSLRDATNEIITYPLTKTKDHQSQDTSLTMDKKRSHGESPLQPEEQPFKKRRLVKNDPERTTRTTIVCFGSNQTSALGLPSLTGDLYDFHTPNEVEGIRQLPADVVSVAATSCSTVCLTRDGRVYTMGSDEGGL
jgi:alpha-tubulin suppressor-like RCC1 family protein